MDVVIIGAGIVGTSAALTLAERGVSVTVLDRGPVAGQASGLNAGLIGGGGWGDRPDVDVTLKMGSRQRYLDLAQERGHDIGLDLTGTLTLIRTAAEWEWAAATVETSRRAGRQLELVTGAELIDLEPNVDPELVGAILDPLGARAEPVAATRAFAVEAQRAGAVIETGCTVTGLRPRAGGGWEVEVDRPRPGAVGAEAVIIAAGAWCAELGAMVGVEVPIVAVRGQMWASEPRPPVLRHALAACESPLAWSLEPASRVGEEEAGGDGGGGGAAPPELTHRAGRRLTRHLYGRQRPNGELVFGGDRVWTSADDRTVDGDGIAVNHAHVAELVPLVAQLPPARTWSGLMPFTRDGRPLIGPVAEAGHDGLYLAGGLASSGFGRGPMAGQLIADLATGRDAGVDLGPVSPAGRVRRRDDTGATASTG